MAGVIVSLRFLFLLALLAAGILAQERLTPELLQQLRRISDPVPSPDGNSVLYGVRTVDLAANKGTTQLHVLDVRTREVKQMTSSGSNFNGRWSKDGRQIAFVSTRSGTPQIWTMRVDGGEAQQVTQHEGGVANMSWSPTSSHFAFTAAVKLDQDVHDLYPDLPKANARLYDSLMVRHWDEWVDGKYSHLFVVPVQGGAVRDLMAGERYDTPLKPFGGSEQICWSADGKQICYTAKKVDGAAEASSTDSDLFVVDIETGGTKNITDGLDGFEIDPVFSPDGKSIAFLSMQRAGFEADRNRLYLHETATGNRRELLPLWDQSVASPSWSDSGNLVFASEVKGTTQIYSLSLTADKPVALSQGRFQFDHPAVRGTQVYALRQSTERPPELVLLQLGQCGEGVVLSRENDAVYQTLKLPKVEERWFSTTDGKKLHAWLVLPPDFDPNRKWPMLLYCQGGPQSMVGQWFSTRWNFHLMAAKGYVVLAVNRRGLPGFGQDWNDQISKDWGGQAMQDLLTATDAMQREPYIDAKRTAAVGASFGGYTIYWLMGHDQKDRFCAMIAHCGVFNLESMYGSTEELWFVNWDLGGAYWHGPDVQKIYDQNSPHRFVGAWDTPLLVIHGEKDFRVPYQEGLQAFTAAQVRGIPSRFLCFPEEGHWINTPQNAVVWHRVFFDWLDRHCKKGL